MSCGSTQAIRLYRRQQGFHKFSGCIYYRFNDDIHAVDLEGFIATGNVRENADALLEQVYII